MHNLVNHITKFGKWVMQLTGFVCSAHRELDCAFDQFCQDAVFECLFCVHVIACLYNCL